jgi:hypothetical protein
VALAVRFRGGSVLWLPALPRGEAMTTKATQLREMAAECRELAAVTKSEEIRRQLLRIAEQFERLAGEMGKRKLPRPRVTC